jgi:hypothetical protein
MPSRDTILALALLKTNWELHGKSYIDNFNLLTAECLRRSSAQVVSVPEIRHALLQNFGLNLPLNIVATLLKRASKQGFVTREHGVFKINQTALVGLKFSELQAQVLEKQDVLFADIVNYAKKRFAIIWTKEDAERVVQEYLAEEAVTILRATSTYSYVPIPRRPSLSDRYVLASYVNHLIDSKSHHFENLRVLTEGNLLARGIFLPETHASEGRKFHNIRIFFDTKFILSALGYAGASLGAPNVELLRLLKNTGAMLCCFVHTLDEVRSVLSSVARNLRGFPGFGPVYDYFFLKGSSESDVLLLATRLERDLAHLGLAVYQTPDYDPKYMPIDEKKLEECIITRINYSNPNALIRDIASISAVIRLRGDDHPRFLESCGALFVTTNRPLVESVLQFTRTELPDEQVTIAVTDGDLNNIVWLKQPVVAEELPRQRLVAICYAAMQPSEEFRKRYLREIDCLESSGKYTERDVYLLRHSLEARRIAMDLTLGNEEAFTQGTATEVLEVMHFQIQHEAEKRTEEERSRADAATERLIAIKEDIAAAKRRVLERQARREERAANVANIFAWIVAGLTSVFLAGLLYFALPLALPSSVPIWARLSASFIVAGITLITWITPKLTVSSFRARMKRALTGPILKLFSWIAGD